MAFHRLFDATQFERPLVHGERIPRQLGGFQHIAQTDQSGCPLATFAGEGCSKDGEESAKQSHRKEHGSFLTEEGELLRVAFPRSSDLELCSNLYQSKYPFEDLHCQNKNKNCRFDLAQDFD